MGKLARVGTFEVTVGASPEQVWDLLTDIERAGEWSHETRGGEWLDGAHATAVGARFRGRNANGLKRWSRTCEIVEADRPRRVSWRTVPSRLYPDSTLWTYDLAPADGGTRITQSFQVLKLSPFFDRLFYLAIPAHRDRSEALVDDLHNLGTVAAQGT